MLLGGALALAPPAGAHDELVSTTPRDGSGVPAPSQVILTFAEPVLPVGNRVDVSGPGGEVASGAPMIQGSTLHQMLRPQLRTGGYRVTWRAVSADGHPVSGTFGFTVTASSATATATPLTAQQPGATSTPDAATSGAGTAGAHPASAPTSANASRIGLLGLGLLGLGALVAAAGVALARRRAGQGRG